MIRILIFASVTLMCVCCESNPEVPAFGVSDYFPLQKGLYFLYDVDDTQIALNMQTRSVYEMKIVVSDSQKNVTGGYAYVLSRYKRVNANSSWTPMETWSARRSTSELVLKEGNTSYVALASPIFENRQWNGNSLNNLGGSESCGDMECDIYSIIKLGSAFSVGNKLFENALTVVEHDDPDLLTIFDVRKISFAKSVGIISIEKEIREYCSDATCYGSGFVNKGYKYKQTLKEYGKE